MTESVCVGSGSVLAGRPSITGTASDARLCDQNTACHHCIWDHKKFYNYSSIHTIRNSTRGHVIYQPLETSLKSMEVFVCSWSLQSFNTFDLNPQILLSKQKKKENDIKSANREHGTSSDQMSESEQTTKRRTIYLFRTAIDGSQNQTFAATANPKFAYREEEME
ncbi:hypothetical protein F2Q69_00053083 [Brassica cretica]|uniref:Uncharacterized protein n=1 Tax=Brassica cretica TaxID=69181 RepID=A0A8S9N4I2_BRACR|nr:hypothetical protein F2Q69_00053083 [Brassica cretica]